MIKNYMIVIETFIIYLYFPTGHSNPSYIYIYNDIYMCLNTYAEALLMRHAFKRWWGVGKRLIIAYVAYYLGDCGTKAIP